MRIALLDIKVGTKVGSNFTAVNMRNMILLEKELGADFYYSTDQLINNNKEYDVFIFGFGSINSDIENVKKFVLKSNEPKLIFVSGEYEQSTSQPLWYLNKPYIVIKNYETLGKLGGRTNGRILKTFDVNLNILIAKQPNQLITKKYDCIYYGRWREDRANYFKKYIQDGLYLSTSTKNMKKFKHEGCNPKYLDTISWNDKKETLNLFKYSLYIEDKYTHKVFNNLANRWYEAGFCNNVVFFDVNCWNTIRKSELAEYENEIKNYIVTDKFDLQEKINECNLDFEKHLAIQKNWRKNELQLRTNMIEELKEIINK
jgi:hypothetical protein